MSAAEQAEFMRPTLEKYERESSCYYSSARLWDDGVLDPLETRSALALGIAASLNAPIPPAATSACSGCDAHAADELRRGRFWIFSVSRATVAAFSAARLRSRSANSGITSRAKSSYAPHSAWCGILPPWPKKMI